MSKLIIFGDSIAAGAWDAQGGWSAQLIAHLNQRTIDESDFYCMAYNLGVSGNCVSDVVSRFDSEVASRHELGDPLMIILAIGTNDGQYLFKENSVRSTPQQFRSELMKLAALTHKWAARMLVLGPGPVDESKVDSMSWTVDKSYRNSLLQNLSKELQSWCEGEGYPFVEMYDRWLSTNYEAWLSDGVHPNSEGHSRIFQLVLGEMERLELLDRFREDTI